MLRQLGHSINAPDAIDVICMEKLQRGHDTEYSFVSRTRNGGPLTIDGILDAAELGAITSFLR